MIIIYHTVLSNESLIPSKLRRHLETNHPTLKSKEISYFKRLQYAETNSCIDSCIDTTINNKNKYKLIVSLNISQKIAKSKKPHTITEELIVPCAINIINYVSDEHHKEYSSQI